MLAALRAVGGRGARGGSTVLRTDRGDQAWFVTQPRHAELAGYLAAHWGNREFARPGHFAPAPGPRRRAPPRPPPPPGARRRAARPGHLAPAPDPERLGAGAVLGIAQHDSGWGEWDAAPPLREADGLPLGLAEVVKNQREG